MTPPSDIHHIRAVNHRRLWIGLGAALLVCSAFFYWAILDSDATRLAAQAAIRRANPGSTICFTPDPLRDIKLWTCGINALASIGLVFRRLLIRLPGA